MNPSPGSGRLPRRSRPGVFGKAYEKLFRIVQTKDRFTAFLLNDRLTALVWGLPVHRKLRPMAWDLTTICLKKAIDRLAPDGAFRYLDMGCGHIGLLGQYLKKLRPDAEVISADVYTEFVENARHNAARNGLRIEFRQSDLFEAVEGSFDLVSFNPPYVPEALDDTTLYPKATRGGPDGTRVMRRFLEQAAGFLAPEGRIFLGINCFFVPEERCREIIRESGYSVEDVVRRPFNTARVFVLSQSGS